MLLSLWRAVRAIQVFSDYRPQPITFKTLKKWLSQFELTDWSLLLKLLNNIRFVSEDETRKLLVNGNRALLDYLKEKDGINKTNVIYISFGDAGSSSPAMLSLLRDADLLEKTGCKFLDWKNIFEIIATTEKLGSGAIIFVDDFIGSSDQFIKARDHISKYIPVTFSQFLLSACICEEALPELGKKGVNHQAGIIHSRVDRSLHPNGSKLTPKEKDRLIQLSKLKRIGKKGGFGYAHMAANIVFYRNAPNSLPLILRGTPSQKQFVGILPRTTDLLRQD